MEENYYATSRNGHELKDMYDPETKTLDICSNINNKTPRQLLKKIDKHDYEEDFFISCSCYQYSVNSYVID